MCGLWDGAVGGSCGRTGKIVKPRSRLGSVNTFHFLKGFRFCWFRGSIELGSQLHCSDMRSAVGVLAAAAVVTAAGTWAPLIESVTPAARSGMSGAVVDGDLVIFGGCSSSCCYGACGMCFRTL